MDKESHLKERYTLAYGGLPPSPWVYIEERIKEATVSDSCKTLARSLIHSAINEFRDPSVFWDSSDDSITFEECSQTGQGKALSVFGAHS